MTLVSNGGHITTSQQCRIRNLSLGQVVWFHPGYITNVLSLGLLKTQFKITYDSSKGGAFIVHRKRAPDIYFHCYSNGLHILEMNNRELVLMNTVRDNMRGYSKDQIKQAKIARDLLSIIGYPSDKDFKSIIDASMIKNQ